MIHNPHFALNNGGESFRQLSNLLKSNENKTVRRFQGCTIRLLNGRTYTLCFTGKEEQINRQRRKRDF